MRISFNFNFLKTLEVFLWILNEKPGINQYNLLKVLFHADRMSVNSYGVPITGETYYAYQFGTVPENTYRGLLNKDTLYQEFFNLDKNNMPYKKKGYLLYSNRKANEDHLSETDKECLTEGIKEYGSLLFNGVKLKNHEEPGWQKTWDKLPNSPIDWYDLVENVEIREELLNSAKYLVI